MPAATVSGGHADMHPPVQDEPPVGSEVRM
jgi:hypothetical protein